MALGNRSVREHLRTFSEMPGNASPLWRLFMDLDSEDKAVELAKEIAGSDTGAEKGAVGVVMQEVVRREARRRYRQSNFASVHFSPFNVPEAERSNQTCTQLLEYL